MAAPATSSTTPPPDPPTPPFTAPISVHILETDVLHPPELHHLALLSDIYLLPCSPPSACPSPPNWDALTSSARIHLRLDRLPPASPPSDLHAAVAAFDHPSITSGFALRVTGTTRPSRASVSELRKTSTRVLVAPTEAVRDGWLASLRLQLAPASMIFDELVAVARGTASEGVLAIDARRALARVTASRGTSLSVAAPETEDGGRQDQSQDQSQSQGQGQDAGDDEGAGAVRYAQRAIELVKTGGASSNFSTTCLQAFHDVVSVGNVETLSPSFGGVALVGPLLVVAGIVVKSLLVLSLAEAELPNLVGMTGRVEAIAQKLFIIAYGIVLSSSRSSEEMLEEFVEDALAAFVDCAELAGDLEHHILHKPWRAGDADDVAGLRARLAELEASLIFSRHAQFAAGLETRFAEFGDPFDRGGRAQDLEQNRVGLLKTSIVGIEELNPSIAGVREEMATGFRGDAYTPVLYRVPQVPPNVVLDGLAQLKPLLEVLSSSGGISVVSGEPPAQPSSGSTSFLSSEESAHALATRGWGGVGKTLACIIIAQDEAVQKAFPGGVAFLNFGEQVMDTDVVLQLRGFILATGGNSPEGKSVLDAINKVEPTRTQVSRVVGLVSNWVHGRRVLFVADNLFRRAHGVPWAEELAKLAEIPGNALLYSTRFNDLAEFAPPQRRFLFECVKDSAIAREIFFRYAGLELNAPVQDPVQIATIDLILSTCAGWHLPLEMAGKIVQKLRYNWAKVKERIDNALLVKLSLHGQGGVGVIMSASLKLLGELPAGRLEGVDVPLSAFENSDYFENIYRRLAVLSKVKSVPLSLLPLVFGVADEDAGALAWLFHDAGLATIEKRVELDSGEGSAAGCEMFSLHDLQLQFASNLCTMSGRDASVSSQHWLFLSECCTLGTGARLSIGEHEWSMFCSAVSTPRDEYIRNNLFWHLAAASEYRSADVKGAILCILSDSAWLRGRMCADGFMSAVWDCKIALAAEETCRFSGEEKKTLEALRQAVMEMGAGVSVEFDGTFASAMIQRAGLMSNRVGTVFPDVAFSKRLAKSAESEVCGAWLRPVAGCSRATCSAFLNDSRLLEKVKVGDSGCLWAVAALGDGEHVVSVGGDGYFGRLCVHKSEDLDAVLDWNGRCSMIRAIAVYRSAPNGSSFIIFSGGEDEDCKGYVRFWEIAVDATGAPHLGADGVVGECRDVVCSLSISEDGLRLSAGCQDGLVFIWNRANSMNIVAFDLVASFLCGTTDRLLTREMSKVKVAVSSSGAWVTAGTWAGDMSFWEGGGATSEGRLVRVASTRPGDNDDKIQSIVFIDGELSVVVFFSFPAGFEVWNLRTSSMSTSRKKLCGLEYLQTAAITSIPVQGEGIGEGGGAVSQTRFLVSGDLEDGGQNVLLEFDSLSGSCVARYDIEAQAYGASYVTIGGARRAVAGCTDRAVLLFDVSGSIYSSLSGMNEREGASGSLDMEVAGLLPRELRVADLLKVCAVAIMPKREIVLAGHDDGTIFLWCAKSGNYEGRFKKANADQVLCLDVIENENMVVSGHAGGSIVVWHVDHRHARHTMRANSSGIISLTISMDGNRIISVDEIGDIRSWDATAGGNSAWVVSSALGFSGIKYVPHQKRACRPAISRDGKFFVWAMRSSLVHWRAKLIDLHDGREVASMENPAWSDGFGFYRYLSECLERDGLDVALGWRFGASIWGRFIELPPELDREESVLKICPGGIVQKDPPVLQVGGSKVRCFLETSTMHVLSDAEFDFGKTTGSFAAGWVTQSGNSPRRVVIACWVAHSNRPAILHHIPARI